MTQPKPPGPRVWWIQFTHNIQEETFVHECPLDTDNGEVVHVIEMSAFQKLESELREAKEALKSTIDDAHVLVNMLKAELSQAYKDYRTLNEAGIDMTIERDQALAELAELYKALEPNENTLESAKGEIEYLRDLEQIVGKKAFRQGGAE